MKLRHDFAGHYNRPDIFHLHINRAAPQLYSVHGGDRLPGGPAPKLAMTPGPSALLASPEIFPDENDGNPGE
jgi:aliphatic nitrilase